MNAAALLSVAIVAIAVVVTALAMVIVVRRALRRRSERRTRALAAPVRHHVLAVAGGDPEEVDAAVEALCDLPDQVWESVLPSVVGLLAKIRGDSRAALVQVLVRRGVLGRARRDARRAGAVRRARACDLLGLAGRPGATRVLVRALNDPVDEVRAVAARALGRLGDPRAAAALLAAADGPTRVPPRILASALVRLGPGCASTLVDTLAVGSPPSRAVAAEIAGLVGATGALPRLVEALDSPDLDLQVRAATALGGLGLPSAVGPLLAAVAADHRRPVRAAAAEALAGVCSGRDVPTLIGLLSDPEHWVGTHAAAALVAVGPAGHRALAMAADAGGPDPVAADRAREALALGHLRGDIAPSATEPAPEPASEPDDATFAVTR